MLQLVVGLLVVAVTVLAVLLATTRRALAAARHELGDDRHGRAVVVVDVRNADELAAEKTKLARALSLLAPSAVRVLVHRELIRQLKDQLDEQGVQAEIKVRRLPSGPTPPTGPTPPAPSVTATEWKPEPRPDEAPEDGLDELPDGDGQPGPI